MKLVLPDFFALQVYERQFLVTFERMARTITGEYIQEALYMGHHSGCSLSFEDRMQKTRALSAELDQRARQVCTDYRDQKGRGSCTLTKGCHRIIKDAVYHFLQAVS